MKRACKKFDKFYNKCDDGELDEKNKSLNLINYSYLKEVEVSISYVKI